MSDVFISYAREDRDRVEGLANLLRQVGLYVWWDRDIIPGSKFDEEIEKQIMLAKCVVVVWSKASIKSKWVRSEADLANSRGVIIPVLFDQVAPPLAFRLIQAANLTNWEPNRPHPGINSLFNAITTISGCQLKPHPAGVKSMPKSGLTRSGIPSRRYRGTDSVKRTTSVVPKISRKPQQTRSGKTSSIPTFPDGIEIRWELALPGEVHQPPIVGPEGDIFIITRNGALICIDENGSTRWSAIVGGGRGIGGQGIIHSPARDVLAVTDGYINCVSVDGTNRWRWTEKGGVTAAPAVNPDGTVFAMTNQSTLWAVSKSGKSIWSQKLCQIYGGGSWPSPAFAGDGLVYAACKGRNVYGVNVNNGELLWKFEINDAVSSSPVAGNDQTGYFASDAGWVFAIDTSGQQQWVASVSGGSGRIAHIDAPLTITNDGTLLVAPRHGKIFAIAPTGEILWETVAGGQGTGDRPVAAAPDGRVYAATTNRELIGLSADGKEFMRMPSDGWLSAPGVGSDNTIYIGIGAKLYALDVALGLTQK